MAHSRMARLVTGALAVGSVITFVVAVQHVSAAPRARADARADAPADADLIITKTVDSPTILFGKPVTFFIALRNAGTVTATNVVITDPIPANVVPGRATIGCTSSIACDLTLTFVGTTLSATVSNVVADTIVNMTWVMTPTQKTTVTNVAYVSAGGGGEVNPATNVSTATVNVTGQLTYLPATLQQP